MDAITVDFHANTVIKSVLLMSLDLLVEFWGSNGRELQPEGDVGDWDKVIPCRGCHTDEGLVVGPMGLAIIRLTDSIRGFTYRWSNQP